jgi:hypothetical protein
MVDGREGRAAAARRAASKRPTARMNLQREGKHMQNDAKRVPVEPGAVRPPDRETLKLKAAHLVPVPRDYALGCVDWYQYPPAEEQAAAERPSPPRDS